MSSISFSQRGDFNRTERYLRRLQHLNIRPIFEKYGEMGVTALANATPIETSETANSWYYEIVEESGKIYLNWNNSHVEDGVPIVILIEYGHGTRNGGIVQGQPFVMEAILPIFEQINSEIMEEVTRV